MFCLAVHLKLAKAQIVMFCGKALSTVPGAMGFMQLVRCLWQIQT